MIVCGDSLYVSAGVQIPRQVHGGVVDAEAEGVAAGGVRGGGDERPHSGARLLITLRRHTPRRYHGSYIGNAFILFPHLKLRFLKLIFRIFLIFIY